MKDYDPKNNDTYTKKYTNSMVRDVEIHMFKDDSANIVISVNGKTMTGNFSEESRIIAKNNVLHFSTEKELGLKLLKYKNKETLIPYSLISRYENKPQDIAYNQKTPLFFNIETEKFVFALDKRFLRDIKQFPEFTQNIILSSPSDISIINSAEDQQILFAYDTLSDLEKDTTNIYKDFKEKYLQQMINIYPSEDVIIVAYELEENHDNYFKIKNLNHNHEQGIIGGPNIASHIFSSSNIQFEFIKAKKISDSEFYLYDNEDNLQVKKPFHFKKDEYAQKPSVSNYFGLDDPSLLIIPFSQRDLDILISLKENIDNIFNDLNNLLSSQKNDSELDNPLTQISLETSNYFLLSDNNKPKTNKLK